MTILLLPRISQDALYHRFADTRMWLGIPNFLNVASNVGFLFVAGWAFFELRKRWTRQPAHLIWGVLFTGILLTGFGSAYYHWQPNNVRLIWDRIPMAIVFMSLLAATITEWIDSKAGVMLLAPLLLLGIGSALWWEYTESIGRGDLRLYGW